MFPGFSFKETMSGTYWRLDAPTDERALSFTIVARAANIRRFAKDRTWSIHGTVDAEGLATRRELDGTLGFRLLDQRRLPYRFTFTGDDGKSYELSGQKEWSGLAPVESMTLLPASLYDDGGEEIARATLRFDVRSDLGRWMKSFRLHLFA
ncbi:MAG TPA: hypothetical protein VGG39_09860 [Polyangiaceae bacterium]|jgi:hypothetical protein